MTKKERPKMAFSRLFGIGSKKESKSGDNSNSSLTQLEQEVEGFTLIAPKNPMPPQELPLYPPLPAGAVNATAPLKSPVNSNTLTSQTSANGYSQHSVLDGVPFKLSERCKLKSRKSQNRETDRELEDVDRKLAQVQMLLQTSNYDFRLEKSVVEAEVSGTIRRMQAY